MRFSAASWRNWNAGSKVTHTAADFMMQNFLKAEAARLDARFLEGVTNRAQ